MDTSAATKKARQITSAILCLIAFLIVVLIASPLAGEEKSPSPVPPAVQSAEYSVAEIGRVSWNGEDGTICPEFADFHLNDKGQVAGVLSYYNIAGETMAPRHVAAFLWEDGRIQMLPQLERAQLIQLLGLNNSGQMIGCQWPPPHFLWENGKKIPLVSDLMFLGVPIGINDRGEIIGTARPLKKDVKSNGVTRTCAFLWQRGEPILIYPPEGMKQWEVEPRAINNLGQVAGNLNLDRIYSVGFTWKKGEKMKLLVPLEEKIDERVERVAYDCEAINDRGQVIGTYQFYDSSNEPSQRRAFLWENGIIEDLIDSGPPKFVKRPLKTMTPCGSVASGLNNLGQVIGSAILERAEEAGSIVFKECEPTSETGESNAFLWENGKIVDLNFLLGSDSLYHIACALRINNRGQILASGRRKDGELGRGGRVFLLTPNTLAKVQLQPKEVAKIKEKKTEEDKKAEDKSSLSLKK